MGLRNCDMPMPVFLAKVNQVSQPHGVGEIPGQVMLPPGRKL